MCNRPRSGLLEPKGLQQMWLLSRFLLSQERAPA
jgi:hypothetical protein